MTDAAGLPEPEFETSLDFARSEDARDPLRHFPDRFHVPVATNGEPVVYLTGNSLGLQPIAAERHVVRAVRAWAEHGVQAHFIGADPWLHFGAPLNHSMASIVGASASEVTLMNALTVNLHVLMASFYRPAGLRFRILMERDAFPSDRYAVRSHVRHRDIDPDDAVIVLGPRPGEATLRHEDIDSVIRERGEEIALVLFGGLNYYTGELLDIGAITRAARRQGCTVGFDLAHAAGNVPLRLHDWDVDFAAWCTYKYLNAGPGAPGGIFVHARHASDASLPALQGWWGQAIEDRFQMLDEYVAAPGAGAYEISNPPILSLAPLRASLDLIEEAGFTRMVEKSRRLTGYLEYLIRARLGDSVKVLTPTDPERRGAQLSVLIPGGRPVFDALSRGGVSCDWREPDVIRMSPVPLYNRFEDVYRAVDRLEAAIESTR